MSTEKLNEVVKVAEVSVKPDHSLEYTENLRCPSCNKKTEGEKDYYSLVEGSTKIKKTCIKCRKDTYASYKKNNSDKFKKVDIPETSPIDYNKEYKEYKRCKCCNRVTKGEEDFKNIRSGKLTKTCITCRTSVYASLKKKPRPAPKKKLTNKEKIICYMKLVEALDKTVLTETISKMDNEQINKLIVV